MLEKEQNDIDNLLDKSIEDLAEKMIKVHGPYWKSRLNISKIVLTITSAVLVATISFSESLLGPGKPEYSNILFFSWISFVLSSVSCLYGMWHLHKLNSHYVLLFNSKQQIKNLFEENSNSDEQKIKETDKSF